MKMNKIMRSCLWFLLAGTLTLPLRAEDVPGGGTVDEIASGVGRDETEATKDALANAVRQAIGAIVGIDTLVHNEEVVRDQILTYSDGFVQKYEVVGKPGTTHSGLISITIRARIVRDKLIQKARAANISMREVDGESMFAEAVTKLDQKRSALAMITDEFRDMPQSLVATEVLGKPEYDENTGKVRVAVRLKLDDAAYDAFVRRLIKRLDDTGCPSFSIASVKSEIEDDPEGYRRIYFPDTGIPEKFHYSIQGWRDTNYTVVAVCETYNAKMTSSQWRLFVLDRRIMDAINAKISSLTASIEIVDGGGHVIDSRYLPLGRISNGKHFEGPITFDSSTLGDHCFSELLYIVPFANGRINATTWFSSTIRFTVRGERNPELYLDFDLNPEDLRNAAKVVCKITPTVAPDMADEGEQR